MSPKNKKKFVKRNNLKHSKSNGTDTGINVEKEQVSVPTQQAEKETGTGHEMNERSTQKNCLSIMEQTVDRLKDDDKFVALMEKLLSLSDAGAENRVAGMELIKTLLLNVKNYETEEIGSLKVKLNSVFYPKELKELVINPEDLSETLTVSGFFLFGEFSTAAFLRKNGCQVRVEIKKADSKDYDELSVIREANCLSQLHHENIIKILAFDKTGPRFALEFMNRGDLWTALHEIEFTAKKRFGLVKAVTSAMVYISEKGYVLRNLDIENILLDSQGNCKISNFQYCQYVKDTDGIYIDKDTSLDDKDSAPEVKEKKQFSTKSDVWDMALLAWEVFCLDPKLVASFLMSPSLVRQALTDGFVPEELVPVTYKGPDLLFAYFSNLMDKDPIKRPTFSEIMEELQKCDE